MRGKLLLPILLVSLITAACSLSRSPQPTPTPGQEPVQIPSPTATKEAEKTKIQGASETPVSSQPVAIRGGFDFSNDIILKYYAENAVALTDMYGFVQRDVEWEMPVSSQTLGYLDIDKDAMKGTYVLQLPARPTGIQVDVHPDGQDETGVQVFTVAYSPNLTGGPYSEGDDVSLGWPSYLTSAKTDSENNDEITGGKLVIWACCASIVRSCSARQLPAGTG